MIEVKNLTKTYTLSRQQKKEMGPQFTGDTLDALEGISFACEPGRVYGLLGPNGAGKTITLRIIATIQKRLASAPNIEVTSGMPADTARARIKDGEVDAAIVFAPSFHQQVEARKAGTVNLIYESGDDSEVMLDRLRPHLDQYEQHFRT